MQATLDPSAGAWKTFYLRNKPSAYAVDQTAGTRPLWQALENLDQAKSNYGAIVYNKAPSVLKQLEYLVGDSAFQRGVRAFLAPHAYGNATWRDLLAAIGDGGRSAARRLGPASTCSGRACRWWSSASWCGTGASRGSSCGSDRPATSAPARTPAPAARSRPLWTERTELLLAYRDRPAVRLPVELRAPSPSSRPRPATPPRLRLRQRPRLRLLPAPARLGQRAALEDGALARVDDAFLRAMLWGALWDQVRASRMTPERFVRVALRELPGETDEQIVPVVLARLSRAVGAYLLPADRAATPGRSRAHAVEWRLRLDPDLRDPKGVRRRVHRSGRDAGRPRTARPAALRRLGRRRAAPGSHSMGHRGHPARARRAQCRAPARRAAPARHHRRRQAARRSSPARHVRARRRNANTSRATSPTRR